MGSGRAHDLSVPLSAAKSVAIVLISESRIVDPACWISRPFEGSFAVKSTTCRMFAARLKPAMASILRTIGESKVSQAHQAEARSFEC